MIRRYAVAVCGVMLAGVLSLPVTVQAAQNRPPDNTAVNKRDTSQPTADNAKNNLSDRELMKRIRQDVHNDKSLSTYGHNVKIIASHGQVTLRGPVHSDDEKCAIEESARKHAGEGHVSSELMVKEDHK